MIFLGQDGDTVLHFAAKNPHSTAILLLLLEKGAAPNTRGDVGQTCLHYAALGNNIDAAELLLKYEADKALTSNVRI